MKCVMIVVIFILHLSLSFAQECKFGSKCLFQCHCLQSETCDPETGACPRGCYDGQPGVEYNEGRWEGDGCQLGNLAFNKSTSQGPSTRYNNEARNANDGNLKTYAQVYGPPEEPRWWRVDLGGIHAVLKVTFAKFKNSMDFLSVNVGYSENITRQIKCGDMKKSDNDINQVQVLGNGDVEMKCSQAMIGRFVSIVKDAQAEVEYLVLFQVYVYGYQVGACEDGMWGPGCLRFCNCESKCDAMTGVCMDSCKPGWTKGEGLNAHVCSVIADGWWGAKIARQCLCKDPAEICVKLTGECPKSGCAEWHDGTGCRRLLELDSTPLILSIASNSIEGSFKQWDSTMPGDAPPTQYEIQYRIHGTTTWISGIHVDHTQDGATVRFTQEGLKAETMYEITIVPMSGNKEGDKSPVVSFSTKEKPIPKPQPVPLIILVPSIVGAVILLIVILILVIIIKRKLDRMQKLNAQDQGEGQEVIDRSQQTRTRMNGFEPPPPYGHEASRRDNTEPYVAPGAAGILSGHDPSIDYDVSTLESYLKLGPRGKENDYDGLKRNDLQYGGHYNKEIYDEPYEGGYETIKHN